MSSARSAAMALALFRVVLGLLFAFHGAASLFGVFGGNRGSGQAVEFAVWPGWWAAAIQLVGGVLIMAGLATRPAALLCSGSMAYAYFVVHQTQALLPLNNGGETAALFCWSFFILAILGPGAFSLDGLLRRRGESTRREAVTATA